MGKRIKNNLCGRLAWKDCLKQCCLFVGGRTMGRCGMLSAHAKIVGKNNFHYIVRTPSPSKNSISDSLNNPAYKKYSPFVSTPK